MFQSIVMHKVKTPNSWCFICYGCTGCEEIRKLLVEDPEYKQLRLPKADFRYYVDQDSLGLKGLKALDGDREEAKKKFEGTLRSLYSWNIDEYLKYVKGCGGRTTAGKWNDLWKQLIVKQETLLMPMFIYSPLLEAFKTIVAAKSDTDQVELGGKLVGVKVVLTNDVPAVGAVAGQQVWVVVGILVGK